MLRPSVLFLSPVFPDDRGNGLAMRAGMTLETLSLDNDVYLVVAPVYPGGGESSLRLIERCCVEWTVLQPMPLTGLAAALRQRFRRWPPQSELLAPLAGQVQSVFPAVRFDIVHVFRSYAAPLAASFFGRRSGPRLHLDMDDVEPDTQRSIAALMSRNGAAEGAAGVLRAGKRYARQQKSALQHFDRVSVCSLQDAVRLRSRAPAKDVIVLPNAVREPKGVSPAGDGRRVLFVGSMGYYPNLDAAQWFADQVLPLLREHDVTFRVAGRGSDALEPVPGGVSLAGEVADLGPEYEAAAIVAVPVRAGGGTRIKALEAFARQRAVVATSKAVEGLAVRDGEHVLIADTEQAFADACIALLEDRGLRDRLVRSALKLVRECYSLEAVRTALTGAGSRTP